MTPSWVAQLAPGHAPPAPGLWPWAIGWWGVIALMVLLTAAGLWWWFDRPRRVRRVVLRELARIRSIDADAGTIAEAIENLLRRHAIQVFGRQRVARLCGNHWLRFIEASNPGAGNSGFDIEAGRSLLDAAFGRHDASDQRERWFAMARGFVEHARPGPRVTGAAP